MERQFELHFWGTFGLYSVKANIGAVHFLFPKTCPGQFTSVQS